MANSKLYDESLEWKQANDKTKWQCPYNEGVDCGFRKCIRCGWNPEVARARTEAYENKRRANV